MSKYAFLKFQILPVSDYVINCNNFKMEHQNDEFNEIQTSLNMAKSLLDSIPESEYSSLSYKLDTYRSMKHVLNTQYNMQVVTNATMKIYEIISQLKLLKQGRNKIFCNAELPGGFIIGINHYIKTILTHSSFNWVASSYISDTGTLGDPYGIYESNKSKWLMDSTMNGNLLDRDNIIELTNRVLQRYPKGVDLYTSDAGCDVSSNYNEQEQTTMALNYGQVICGLFTLAIGGSLITKQFTFFSMFNRSLITLLSVLFDKLYIVKPATSRPINSEVYIIGTGFKGITELLKNYLLTKVDNIVDDIPLILYEPNVDILNSARYLYGYIQIPCIQYAHHIYTNKLYIDTREYRKIQDEWILHNPIKTLNKRDFIPIKAKKI